MAIKLILTDIDGTLLPAGQKELPASVFDAFHAALDAGIAIGPASGRALPGIVPTFNNDEACTQTVLATNGMQVYAAGKLIHEEYLDHDALQAVADCLDDIPGAGMIVFHDADIFMVRGEREPLSHVFPLYAPKAVKVEQVPDFPVVKVNLFIDTDLAGTQEFMERVAGTVPQLGFNLPMAGFLNAVPLGYSKATGIDILCEYLGIGLDEVVVFGDGGNDAEMIEHVPNSVAVANAVPQIQKLARWHIGSVDEGAVPAAIAAIAAGECPFVR